MPSDCLAGYPVKPVLPVSSAGSAQQAAVIPQIDLFAACCPLSAASWHFALRFISVKTDHGSALGGTNMSCVLVIEYWNLRFVCNLVFGVWDFIIPPIHYS
jgi:hypothetical protein